MHAGVCVELRSDLILRFADLYCSYAQIFALHDTSGKTVETCVITTELTEEYVP